MKRWLVGLVVSTLVFFGSLGVAAAGVGASLNADYLFGTLESDYTDDSDLTGLLVRAEAPVLGSFGVLGEAAVLKAEDFFASESSPGAVESDALEVLDWGIYGTYALSVGSSENLKLKALGGYGAASFENEEGHGPKFEGFKLGAAAEFKPVEKVTLEGMAVVGLANKEVSWSEDHDATALGWRLSGSCSVLPNLAVEAGYRYAKYELSEDGDIKVHVLGEPAFTSRGFFAGVKATF